MVVKLRLKRIGRKKRPSYRIVAVDSRKKRDGRVLEDLGFYNPKTKESSLNLDKIEEFLDNGAIFTDTVFYIYVKEISKYMINMRNGKPLVDKRMSEVV